MSYTLFTVIGRDSDEKKFEKATDWISKNSDDMGVQVTEDFYCDGSYSIDYQEKTNSFIAEIKTANEKFANDIKTVMEEAGIKEVRMLGVIK